MIYDVPQEIISKASKCSCNYSCLNGTDKKICPEDRLRNDMLFIQNCECSVGCQYRYDFGGATCCKCPVRIYIAKNNGDKSIITELN